MTVTEDRGAFMVRKYFDGKQHYYGRYATREAAERIESELQRCGWDVTQLSAIKNDARKRGLKL